MVVLDHGHVIETHAVVCSASVLHSHLVKYTKSRCCLACVEELGLSAGEFLDVFCCFGSYTAHPLEDIQRETLSAKQGRVGGLDLEDHVTLLHCISVLEVGCENHAVLEAVVYHLDDLKTGNDSILFCCHGGNGVHCCWDDGLGSDVARIDVLFNSEIEKFVD